MKRRLVLSAMTTLLLLVSVVGLGAAQQPVKIVFAVQTIGDIHGELEIALAEKYMAANPHVVIEPVTGAANQILAQLAAGILPDVVGTQTGTTAYIDMALNGHFWDIHALAQRYGTIPGFALSDLHPAFISMHNLNGEEHLLPYRPFIFGMFVNNDLFDEAGVERPHNDWTFDEYRDRTRRVTRDTSGDGQANVWGAMTDPIWSRLAPWVWANGGDFFTEDGLTTLIDQPEVYEVIDWLAELRQIGSMPPFVARPWAQRQQAFIDGTVGVYGPIGNLLVGDMREANVPYSWDVVAPPHRTQKSTFAGTRGYLVSKQSAQTEEAWKFIQYLASWEAQLYRFEVLGQVGTHLELAQLPEVRNPHLAPLNIRMFFEAMSYAQPGPNQLAPRQELDRIVAAYNPVWLGEKTARQVADEMIEGINTRLRAAAER